MKIHPYLLTVTPQSTAVTVERNMAKVRMGSVAREHSARGVMPSIH